jgi:hypothetical protein
MNAIINHSGRAFRTGSRVPAATGADGPTPNRITNMQFTPDGIVLVKPKED